MTQTLTNFDSILKEWYTPDRIQAMILESSPLLAMIPKKAFYGRYAYVPVITGDTGGHSAAFATAQTNKGQSSSIDFNITHSNYYSLASINRDVILSSEQDVGAFLPAARVNIDGSMRQLRRDIAISLYRSGTGTRGVASTVTGVGTVTITLTNPTDAVNFNVSDVIQYNASEAGTTVDAGSVLITSIDISGGILIGTVTGAAPTAAEFLFLSGTKGVVQKGLAAWLPTTAPTSGDSFFGVDRSVNSTMLAGVRSLGTGKTRYEALIDAAWECNANGDGLPTHVFMHPTDMKGLVKEMEATVTRFRNVDVEVQVRKESETKVGFRGIVIEGGGTTMECYADRFALLNQPFGLQLADWKLYHRGKEMVDLINRAEDKGMLLEPSADAYEVRSAGYIQLGNGAPGHNFVISNFGL